MITKSDGCAVTSSCYNITDLVIIENNDSNNVSISPNPFTSTTTVSFSEEQTNTSLKVVNVLGEVIFQSTINGKQSTIDMSGVAKGIYFVRIEDSTKNVVNRKIVVQ